MARRVALGLAVWLVVAVPAMAQLVARQITAADAGTLFSGGDAEGGIGDWYVSNGVIEAVIDDANVVDDLVGIVPPGEEPRINTAAAPTGGTLIDLGRVGAHDDQLSQMFTVGGLSPDNFASFDEVTAAAPGVVRASGSLLFPPASTVETPCLALTTDYRAEGTNAFLTVVTEATNNCGVTLALAGYLDAFVWTQRSLVPFSAGMGSGGVGFDHAIFDLDASALEFPTFLAAPGVIRPRDGLVDPERGLVGAEVAYGLLGVEIALDPDGPGSAAAPVVTPVDSFFGISSTLISALGNVPEGVLDDGGTLTYTRRIYVGDRNDVRSVSNAMLTDLAARTGFSTGTLSGDVDAEDGADVEASIVVVRLGRCPDATACRSSAECGGGACTDRVPTPGFGPGGAVTHVRTATDGTFSGVVLPNGDYELVVSSFERETIVQRPVEILDADTAVAIPALSARGTLAFRVREKRKGKPEIPAKLVVRGVDGTPDPRFAHDLPATLGSEDLRTESFGGTQRGPSGDARGQGNVVYTTTGSGSIELRPGTYEVWASRGMEYSLDREIVTVASGQTAEVDFLLKRVLKTKDALGADFHIHSVRSFDASTPLEDRVASFAAEGVEMMISTEHDKHVDYDPVIQALGLAERVRGIPGVEVTGSVPNPPVFPNSIGHINAWPMPVLVDERRDGAVDDEYVAPNWVYSRLRGLGGADTVVQYNHPRAGVSGLTSIGFFNSIGCGRCANAIDTTCSGDGDCPAGAEQECTCVGYQPDREIDMPPNDLLLDDGVLGPGSAPNPDGHDNLAFDTMEIANGARTGDVESLVEMRRDWFSMLNQDLRKWGTGVSDSHRATIEHAGWPRTYVLGVGDDPRGVDVATFNQRVRDGAMVISAGPFIDVQVKGMGKAGPGEQVATRQGKVKLRLRVTSPAWVPVEEVRIIANGELVETFDATTKPKVNPVPANPETSRKILRLKVKRTFEVDRDSWALVEAGIRLPGEGEPPPESPEVMNAVLEDAVPFAFTNPIFIDLDGDGYTAPGLPEAEAVRTGRMTGVGRAERREAIRAGEYLPIWDVDLAPYAPRP